MSTGQASGDIDWVSQEPGYEHLRWVPSLLQVSLSSVILKDKQLQVFTGYSDGLVDFSQPPGRNIGGRSERNSFSWPFVCFTNIPNTNDFKLLSEVISNVWEEWEKSTFMSWHELALQISFAFLM